MALAVRKFRATAFWFTYTKVAFAYTKQVFNRKYQLSLKLLFYFYGVENINDQWLNAMEIELKEEKVIGFIEFSQSKEILEFKRFDIVGNELILEMG